MKIIIYVDFSNEKFNKDFALSGRLTGAGHTVLLVTNDRQLADSMGTYDMVLRGFSCKKDLSSLDKSTYILNNDEDLVSLDDILKG